MVIIMAVNGIISVTTAVQKQEMMKKLQSYILLESSFPDI